MKTNDFIIKIKEEAIKAHVPIIMDDVREYLIKLIHEHQIKHVLEIGTAVSYSAHIMANAGAHVTTLERHPKMIEQANMYISQSPLKDSIHLVKEDAETYVPQQSFDLIFIDGAKSKYQLFFNRYMPYLRSNGMIVCDNIDFHHLDVTQVSRQTRALLKKLEAFKNFLRTNQEIETTWLSIGDGLTISKRKKR